MFEVLGYLSLCLGTMYYNMYLKEQEVRTLLKYACYIAMIGSMFSVIFVLRLNIDLGISDLSFTIFCNVFLGTLGLAYT